MPKYELIKQIINPCGGDQLPSDSHIQEVTVTDPAAYVRSQYPEERKVSFVTQEQDGSAVVEAVLPGGQRHRFTFTQI